MVEPQLVGAEGGDVRGVGGGVREDRDLGGPGLRVDADPALEQALGGGDVDVAGAGDQVDRAALLGPVREHRDRLGAAGRVHLVHAEQGAGGEDGRVRQAAELRLRRGGDGDAVDAGLLRGDHVHDDGGRVDRQATGYIQADALDRDPALGDRAAGDDLGGDVRAALLAVDDPGAPDRLLQGGPDGRVQLRERPLKRLGGHPDTLDGDPVEPMGVLDQRGRPTMAHVLADGPHLLQGGFHVELGTGQQVAQGAALGEGIAAQIDSGDHPSSVSDPFPGPSARISR